MRTLFVAGTDTDVGKTFFCAHFLRYLLKNGTKAGYQKWVSTGNSSSSPDLDECIAVAGHAIDTGDIALQVPYRFSLPASPHLASEEESQEIDSNIIINAYNRMSQQYDILLVEGVGGLLVPLRRDLLLIDLLEELKPPILLVARSGLGTLNHTLLSLEALQRRSIPVCGVVFSDSNDPGNEAIVADNMKTIAEICHIQVFGRLQRLHEGENSSASFEHIFAAIYNAVLK